MQRVNVEGSLESVLPLCRLDLSVKLLPPSIDWWNLRVYTFHPTFFILSSSPPTPPHPHTHTHMHTQKHRVSGFWLCTQIMYYSFISYQQMGTDNKCEWPSWDDKRCRSVSRWRSLWQIGYFIPRNFRSWWIISGGGFRHTTPSRGVLGVGKAGTIGDWRWYAPNN